MTNKGKPLVTPFVAFIVVCVAIAGYFTGLQSPMNPANRRSTGVEADQTEQIGNGNNGVELATSYSDIRTIAGKPPATSLLTSLKSNIDPLAVIKIEPTDKLVALTKREQNRAFNGAPPTIPHVIEQRSSAACLACHGQGAKTDSLRIPRMSHTFLANCTQCHVESNPPHMVATVFRENSFDGLDAPTAGPRAFEGAPPQIPHSTWMRSDCMSCHGLTGLYGIRSTHPWRTNCQQCHAPSATLDQTFLAEEPKFLPGPDIEK